MRKFVTVMFAGVMLAASAFPIMTASAAESGTQTNSGSARPDAHSKQGGGTGKASEESATSPSGASAEGSPTKAAPTTTNSGQARPDTEKTKHMKGETMAPKKATPTQGGQ